MGKLRDRMLVDLQLSGAKSSTQRTYLREAENLAKYFHKSPEQLGEDQLKAYLLYLMKERHLSEGTFRFYVAALKFLYRTTLKREWAVEKYNGPKNLDSVISYTWEIKGGGPSGTNAKEVSVFI
jgi:integrase/recombinase XerD